MKILGLNINKASPTIKAGESFVERTALAHAAQANPQHKEVLRARAPKVPSIKRDSDVVNTLPPFGTNPPQRPVQVANGSLSDRYIYEDPRSLWYLNLPGKITPNQVLQILRSGLGGDLWQTWQLQANMMDSWPMLRKCSHEIREEVSYANYTTIPYCDDEASGATDEAKERADLVSRAMKSFRCNPFSDEKEWTGMVYDLSDAMLNGISMVELMWTKVKSKSHGIEYMPRAAAWVHPRKYTFGNDGIVALYGDDYRRLYFPLAYEDPATPDIRKFMCAQFRSMSGSSLGAGLIRPLAWYWSSVIFCKEWMLCAAQKYGNPFAEIITEPGMPAQDLADLDAMISMGLSQGWLRHVKGTEFKIHPPTAISGVDNAQRHLMELADSAAMFLLLGQEATTKGSAGKLGNEEERGKVKRARAEGLAKWLGTGPLRQFARAVLLCNYGNDDFCPEIVPDFTEAINPLIQAETDTIFLTNKLPLVASEFYARNGMQMPEAGDKVVIGGQLCVLADDDELVSSVAQPPPMPGEDGALPIAVGTGQSQASRSKVRAIYRMANDTELNEMRTLVTAAEKATHTNGEWDAVVNKLKEIEFSAGRKSRS